MGCKGDVGVNTFREKYNQPNQENVQIGDIFATTICGLTFVKEITEIKENYVLHLHERGFVKGYYDRSIIKSNGNILVGEKADKSLIGKLENLK